MSGSDLQAQIRDHETQLARLYEQVDAQLLREIRAAFRDRDVVVAEVWAMRRARLELQEALTDAGIRSPWQLGKRFRKVQGRDLYGVRLDAIGHCNCGQIWRVTVLADPHQLP